MGRNRGKLCEVVEQTRSFWRNVPTFFRESRSVVEEFSRGDSETSEGCVRGWEGIKIVSEMRCFAAEMRC